MNDEWPSCKLQEVAHIRISNVDKKSRVGEVPIRLCNYMDVYENDYVTEAMEFMAASASESQIASFALRAGDVVITKDSETPDDIGVPAVVMEDIDGLVCGYHLALIRPKHDRIDAVYLAKQLQSAPVVKYFAVNASGSTRFGLSIGAIENVKIPLAPKAEQLKIGEIFSTVDRAIEQTNALIAKQRRISKGLMQELLTRGIDKHGNIRSEEIHEFKDSPIGRIPVEWEVTQLGAVSDFVTSGARGWARYYSEEGAVFLRISNLTRDHINLRMRDVVFVQPPLSAEGRRTRVLPGDLLVSVTADLGIIGVIPSKFGEGYINQHIALVRPDHASVCSRFVGWFFSSREGQAQFRRLNESGAKAGLNLPTVRSLLFPRPDPDEQETVARIIDSSVAVLDRHVRARQKLMSLRTGLLQDLLTGEKRVTALFPEPEMGME